MTTVLAVDVGLLGQVVWVSLAAGVGVSALYSLVILGTARGSEARRAGRTGPALAYSALAVVSFAAFAGGVVYAVHIMFTK
jgi:hypothetical protein